LERNKRQCQGWVSLRSVLKVVGIRPEVREELIRVVRNGRMSPEMPWTREERIGGWDID